MPPIPGIGSALQIGAGLAQGIAGLIGAKKQERKLTDQLKAGGQYQADPQAKQLQALAYNLYNGRMAGAGQVEANIYGNQAGQIANTNRVASSGSQALAAAAGYGGQADNAFLNLAGQEAQNKANNYSAVSGATQGVINENTKQFEDKQRYNDALMNIKATAQQNKFNALGSIFGTVGLAGAMYNNGDFSGGQSSRVGSQMQGMGAMQAIPTIQPGIAPQGLYADPRMPGMTPGQMAGLYNYFNGPK